MKKITREVRIDWWTFYYEFDDGSIASYPVNYYCDFVAKKHRFKNGICFCGRLEHPVAMPPATITATVTMVH